MQVTSIPLAETMVSAEARPLNRPAMEALAESMNRLGLLNPITVYPAHYSARGRSDNPGYRIIAGRHRYEAAKLLGWEAIDALVVEGSDQATRRMYEITENLHRADLSALDRAKLVEEWVELTGEKVGQLAQVSGGRGNKEGVSEASRQLGIERTEVRRSLQIASLSPEAQEAARENGLDSNKSALLEAARKDSPAEQVQVLQERKQIKLAPPAADEFEAREAWINSMMKLWNKAGQDWRQEFMRRAS